MPEINGMDKSFWNKTKPTLIPADPLKSVVNTYKQLLKNVMKSYNQSFKTRAPLINPQ
jgi:hypothetical protein